MINNEKLPDLYIKFMCAEGLFPWVDRLFKYGPWNSLEWFIDPFYHEEGECYEDWFSGDLTVGSPRSFITFSKPDHYADAFSWNLSHSRDGEFEIVNFSYSVYEP